MCLFRNAGQCDSLLDQLYSGVMCLELVAYLANCDHLHRDVPWKNALGDTHTSIRVVRLLLGFASNMTALQLVLAAAWPISRIRKHFTLYAGLKPIRRLFDDWTRAAGLLSFALAAHAYMLKLMDHVADGQFVQQLSIV